jgi:hypothetical protein
MHPFLQKMLIMTTMTMFRVLYFITITKCWILQIVIKFQLPFSYIPPRHTRIQNQHFASLGKFFEVDTTAKKYTKGCHAELYLLFIFLCV